MEQVPRRFDAFISYSQAADGVFAPALEHGLEMLAKPWNRRRALDVFRDSTGLSPTPHLWPDIRRALDDSEWLVVLASPESAASRWVGEEIRHWLATKSAERILIVLTDGACVWDAGNQDFDRTASTAVHPALRFADEPLYIDMTWARQEELLTLENPRFRLAVAQIASPMHGLAPEDLESEAVRQERRLRRLARSAVGAMAALTAVATLFAVLFANEAGTVSKQRDAALARALVADGIRLAGIDPEVARRLAVVAWRLAPTPETRANLMASARWPGLAVRNERGQVAFARDGRTLAIGARLLDAATREPVGNLATDGKALGEDGRAVFSSDGRIAATIDGNHVRLWDTRTRRPLRTVSDWAGRIAMSPKGPMLAVEEGGHVTVRDLTTNRKIARVTHESLTDVAFTADGKRLITVNEDRMVLWSLPDGKRVKTLRHIANQGMVELAVSPDGRTVATGADTEHSGPSDRRVRLWDLKSGRWTGDLDGHTDAVTALAFNGDGSALASGSQDERILVWDLATRRPAVPALTGHSDAITSVAWGAGGLLASSQLAGPARLWEVSAGRTLGPAHTNGVDTVAFTPDGTLASGSGGFSSPRWGLPLGVRDHAVRLWRGGKAAGTIDLGEGDSVYGLAGTRQGRLVVGADSGRVTVWDPATRRTTGPAIKARAPVTSVTVNADATVIATSSEGSHLRLWDAARGKPIGSSLAADADSLSPASVVFSPTDRKLLAYLDSGNAVRLWNIETGMVVATLSGHSGPVYAVAFSPDGTMIATGGQDNILRLWSTRSGAPIGGPLSVGADVMSLAFSPKGLLAAGDADGDVRVWEFTTRELLGAAFPAHLYAVSALAFSPDGGTLASGGQDFQVRLWDLAATLDPLRAVCARAPRPLTSTQWADHLPGLAFDPRLQAC